MCRVPYRLAGMGGSCLGLGEKFDLTLTSVQWFPSRGVTESWRTILSVTVEDIT